MTHKILHIIAVLFTALAAALILPRFVKTTGRIFLISIPKRSIPKFYKTSFFPITNTLGKTAR